MFVKIVEKLFMLYNNVGGGESNKELVYIDICEAM